MASNITTPARSAYERRSASRPWDSISSPSSPTRKWKLCFHCRYQSAIPASSPTELGVEYLRRALRLPAHHYRKNLRAGWNHKVQSFAGGRERRSNKWRKRLCRRRLQSICTVDKSRFDHVLLYSIANVYYWSILVTLMNSRAMEYKSLMNKRGAEK